ncbi:MAG TPA: hypothetical protein VGL77_09280 [Armatimonadota bacterium]|jgi:hypothetical protein
MKKFILLGVTGAMLLSALGASFAAGPVRDRGEAERQRPSIVVAVKTPNTFVRIGGTRQYHRGYGKDCRKAGANWKGHRHHGSGHYGHRAYQR